MAADGRIPVARQRYFESQNLNVCFHWKRSFKLLEITRNEGPLTANSGPLAISNMVVRRGPEFRLVSVDIPSKWPRVLPIEAVPISAPMYEGIARCRALEDR